MRACILVGAAVFGVSWCRAESVIAECCVVAFDRVDGSLASGKAINTFSATLFLVAWILETPDFSQPANTAIVATNGVRATPCSGLLSRSIGWSSPLHMAPHAYIEA
jgi:hypothetical protein